MEKRESDVKTLQRLKNKRQRKRMWRIGFLVIAAALVLAYFTGFFGASIAVMGDVVDSAVLLFSPGKGYPANLSLVGFSKGEAVRSSYVLLGENDLVIHSSSAKEVVRLQHGYAKPSITTGNARVCIYNRSGTELQVLSRRRTLFVKSFEKPILLAEMSPGGNLAVATRSERFMAQVTVFNTSFEELYTWYSATDTPMLMEFASDNNRLAIACPVAEGGALGTSIQLLNKSTEVTKIHNASALALQMKYLPGNELMVVYEDCTIVYNSSTGEELARYVYGGRNILYAGFDQSKNLSLVFGDKKQVSVNQIVVVDNAMQELLVIPVGEQVEDIVLTRDRVYVLTGPEVLKYNLKGELLETIHLESHGEKFVYAKKVLVVTAKEIVEVS